jgi:hypothetical protein
MRAATASIDLDALRHNIGIARSKAPHSRLIAIVKANAYGHGLARVLPALSDADALGVACSEEALILGAGAQFGQIGVDLRYDLGLTNINEGVNDVKSSAFTVSFAYAFARR